MPMQYSFNEKLTECNLTIKMVNVKTNGTFKPNFYTRLWCCSYVDFAAAKAVLNKYSAYG